MQRGKNYRKGIPAPPTRSWSPHSLHHDQMGRTASQREEEVLAYIVTFAKEHHGHMPTLRQICMATRVSSTSVASYTIANLVTKGYLAYVDTLLVIAGSRLLLPADAKTEGEAQLPPMQ